jgi:outer membrane receptor for ferrienterochelin and colicins
MIDRFPIVILLAFITFTVFSQTGTISGFTKSGSAPVEFAHVVLQPGTMGSITDANGNFTIKNVPLGKYTLTASAVGYFTSKKQISVNDEKNISISIDLKEDVAQLEEVVVTGTMREVSRMSSPISVEVFSPALFRKNPTPNVFESLSIINGVQPQLNCNVCNTGDIHINGLEGPYTMILIDGMPIVSSLSTVYGLSGIPNSMVKRIEVVKGPASTLYGSEAVGGVINIITKEPLASPLLRVDAFGTSLGEYNLDASVALKNKKVNSLLGINYFNYTLKRDVNKDNFTDVTLQNRVSVFNKWNFNRKSGKNFTLAGRYVYENRWGGEMQWTNEYRGSDVYYGESIYTNRAEFIGNYQLPGRENFNIDLSYNYHIQDSYYGIVKYFASQQTAFSQLRWNKTLGKHDLFAGLPLRYINYDDNTVGTSLEGQNNPRITFLPGIFVQDELQFSKITLLAGARYDHHNIHGNIFTPRLSLKWSPSKNETIRLTSGSGYRVVNLFTEEHAALTGAREVVVKNSLRPEKSWNVNMNYSRLITHSSGFINLDASLFYTYFTNKIIGDYDTDPDLIIYDNLDGHAISQGATVNADLSFTNNFKFMAGITLMDVYRKEKIDFKDERIKQFYAPGFSGTFSMSYTFDKPQLTFDLTGRVNGPMRLPTVPNDFRPEYSPWFGIINLQATKTMGKWEFYGGVKNLLNFIPGDPLLRPFDPFDKNIDQNNPYGYTFDTSYNYAPVQGVKGFFGVRFTVN